LAECSLLWWSFSRFSEWQFDQSNASVLFYVTNLVCETSRFYIGAYFVEFGNESL
jgi:hypothetical protein